MLYAIVGMLVIILDQIVKYWVDTTITQSNLSIALIPNVLSIVRVQNDGAAFSFLSGGGARIWFIVLTAVFTIAVILALATNFVSGKFGRWCLVMVTAGGLANCIDRVLYGYVIDMFKVELFNFAVFNVADIFITVFCIAFIIYILFGGEKKKDEDEDEFNVLDEEDEDRPKLKPKRKTRQRVVAIDEEDEDEDDIVVNTPRKRVRPPMEEEVRAPRRAPAAPQKPARKPQASLFDEMDMESSRPQRSSRTASFDSVSNDPFAEWERANARARTSVSRVQQAQSRGEARPSVSGPTSDELRQLTSDLQMSRPSASAYTQAAPKVAAPKKAAAVDEEFDLDSILNEFK